MATEQDNILIIGGGVAGLVLAQGLKYRGIPFKVFERDPSFAAKDQGYRFRCEGPGLDALEETLSPDLWQLLERTHAKDSPPVCTWLDPSTSEKKGEMNTIQDPSPRAQRCYPIDRPWFRELLYLGIEDDIVFGKGFQSYTIHEDAGRKRVTVSFTDGSTANGRLVVAADGVRSRVRQQVLPHHKQIDLGRMIIWGRTPLTAELRSKMPKTAFATHFASLIDAKYPYRCALWAPIEWPEEMHNLSGGKLTQQSDYVFWALSTEHNKDVLSKDATINDYVQWIRTVTSAWDPAMQELFQMQDKSKLAAIPVYSSRPDLDEWETNPCVTLLGDAIHAMAPTGGVGGRTAIEDARDLCKAIADVKDTDDVQWKDRLGKYEQGMRARAKVAVEQSFRGGKRLWAGKDWWEYDTFV